MDYNEPPKSHADDSLDELIRESLRLESDPLCINRLERHWRGQSQRLALRRLAWRAIPLTAAAMLLAIYFFYSPQDRPQQVSTPGPNPEQTNDHDSTPDRVSIPGPISVDWQAGSEPTATADNFSAGRPPTTYERLLFVAKTRIQEPSTPPSATAALEKAVDRIANEPAADARAICSAIDISRDDGETLLLEQLSTATAARQRAIMRLLSVYGTERSLPQLIEQSSNETDRHVSFATIEAIVGVERLGEVVRMASDEQVRYALLQRLLAAETPPALIAYLAVVRDDSLRDEAIAAGVELPQLPIQRFIELLGHEDEAVRLSSAIVLGRMNRCEMTEALIARIQLQPSDSKEAWFALFACRCDAADTFLIHATRSPKLLGQFNNARLQWSRLSF